MPIAAQGRTGVLRNDASGEFAWRRTTAWGIDASRTIGAAERSEGRAWKRPGVEQAM